MVKGVLRQLFSAESLMGRMIVGFLYLFVYNYLFVNFVYENFSYMGVDYVPMSMVSTALWLILSIAPFLFFRGVRYLSSFINLLLYFFVYIPFVHALFVVWGLPWVERYANAFVLCCFFVLYFYADRGWCLFKNMIITPQIPLRVVEVITLLLTVVVIAVNHSQMHLVNIFTQMEEMYDFRAENAENRIVAIVYLRGWLTGAFYPFLLVCYLRTAHYKKALLIVVAYFLMFMMDMQKMTFLLPFILLTFYVMVHAYEKKMSDYLHSIMVGCIILFSLVMYLLQDNVIVFSVGTLLMLRTVCVAGWLTQFYFRFFAENPYTHYAHINIINAITNGYPYGDEPLGRVVAYDTQNANANFFLTDGIAAWGVGGLVFICLFYLVFLHFLTAVSYRYRKADLFVIFLPTVSYLMNVSIFTTLLTNGMGIVILLLLMTSTPITTDHEDNQ